MKKPVCEFCKNPIHIKRPRDKYKRFCNRACLGLSRRNEQIPCEGCGQLFRPARKYYRFCSKQCANKSRHVVHIRKCQYCQEDFELDNIAYEKRGGGKYCSPECATASRRIYTVDEDFFERIDTPNKAYLLGFIMADGNIYRTTLTIRLKKDDLAHLEKIKTLLHFTGPIKPDNDGKSVSLRISSLKICQDLEALKCTSNKSLTLEYPEIPDYLEPHFIRGYFDGDGSISIVSKKQSHLKRLTFYSGSLTFMDTLQEKLERQGLFLSRGKSHPRFLKTSKQSLVRAIFDFMYDGSEIHMERKFRAFA